jgi:hypothetical protein
LKPGFVQIVHHQNPVLYKMYKPENAPTPGSLRAGASYWIRILHDGCAQSPNRPSRQSIDQKLKLLAGAIKTHREGCGGQTGANTSDFRNLTKATTGRVRGGSFDQEQVRAEAHAEIFENKSGGCCAGTEQHACRDGEAR